MSDYERVEHVRKLTEQMVALYKEGHTRTAIAEELGVSAPTVTKYLQRSGIVKPRSLPGEEERELALSSKAGDTLLDLLWRLHYTHDADHHLCEICRAARSLLQELGHEPKRAVRRVDHNELSV